MPHPGGGLGRAWVAGPGVESCLGTSQGPAGLRSCGPEVPPASVLGNPAGSWTEPHDPPGEGNPSRPRARCHHESLPGDHRQHHTALVPRLQRDRHCFPPPGGADRAAGQPLCGVEHPVEDEGQPPLGHLPAGPQLGGGRRGRPAPHALLHPLPHLQDLVLRPGRLQGGLLPVLRQHVCQHLCHYAHERGPVPGRQPALPLPSHPQEVPGGEALGGSLGGGRAAGCAGLCVPPVAHGPLGPVAHLRALPRHAGPGHLPLHHGDRGGLRGALRHHRGLLLRHPGAAAGEELAPPGGPDGEAHRRPGDLLCRPLGALPHGQRAAGGLQRGLGEGCRAPGPGLEGRPGRRHRLGLPQQQYQPRPLRLRRRGPDQELGGQVHRSVLRGGLRGGAQEVALPAGPGQEHGGGGGGGEGPARDKG